MITYNFLSRTTVNGYESICGHRLRHSPGKKVVRCTLSVFMYLCVVLRLRRDISERKRDLEGVLKQYNKFVKPVSSV